MIRFLRGSIIVAAILIIILEFFGLRDFLKSPYMGIKDHNLQISRIQKGGPNDHSSLQVGDLIVAVNGIKVNNISHYHYLTSKNDKLEPFIFTMQRNDKLLNVTVKTEEQPLKEKLIRFGFIISGFTFIVVGFIVIFKRLDILGILFSVNCFLIAFILTDRPAMSFGILHVGGELLYDLLFIFMPAFFLHFFLMFPGREIKSGTRRYKTEKYLYYPPAIIYLISFILALTNYTSAVDRTIINTHETIASLYWVSYMILSPVVFIRAYRSSSKALKTKFRIVTFGLAIGILPLAIIVFIMQINLSLISHNYLYLSGISLSFISISFGYTILKHDAFNSRLVLKRTIVYMGIPLLFAIFYCVIEEISKDRISEMLDLNRYYFSAVAIVLFAILFVPARSFVFNIFERYFYNKRSDIKKSLIDFSHNIRLCKTPEEIISCLTEEMINLFQPENVQVFLSENDGTCKLRYVYPTKKMIPVTKLPLDIELFNQAEKNKYPLMLEYFDSLWIKYNFDRISRELVNINKGSTIIAISADDVMNGFIIVGPKTTGGIYTSEDAELLNFLGERTAASLRNIELCRINLEKEELENEIRIASGIQQKLLPKFPPTLLDAQVAAKIRTSKQVGGDFYDFFELGSRVTGMAISDIAGKGIPAAFLMSTIQASLSAQARLERQCADVLYFLNNHVFEKSDSIRHATMFYCLYDQKTAILNYANAGAVPPVILKKDGKILRLKRGGLVLGIEKNVDYLEGAVKLERGDLMIAFTDGILDQESEEGIHFGFERLIQFVRDNHQLPLQNLLDKLFITLEDFGNKKMKDDMTVIILRKN